MQIQHHDVDIAVSSLLYIEEEEDFNSTSRYQYIPILPHYENDSTVPVPSTADSRFVQKILIELEDGGHRIVVLDSSFVESIN